MTAAYAFALMLLAVSAGFLIGEMYGRRRERIVRDRIRRRQAENAYDELTIRLALADADALRDNDRWSRSSRQLEVVR